MSDKPKDNVVRLFNAYNGALGDGRMEAAKRDADLAEVAVMRQKLDLLEAICRLEGFGSVDGLLTAYLSELKARSEPGEHTEPNEPQRTNPNELTEK